jgi:hypothetical protein
MKGNQRILLTKTRKESGIEPLIRNTVRRIKRKIGGDDPGLQKSGTIEDHELQIDERLLVVKGQDLVVAATLLPP